MRDGSAAGRYIAFALPFSINRRDVYSESPFERGRIIWELFSWVPDA